MPEQSHDEPSIIIVLTRSVFYYIIIIQLTATATLHDPQQCVYFGSLKDHFSSHSHRRTYSSFMLVLQVTKCPRLIILSLAHLYICLITLSIILPIQPANLSEIVDIEVRDEPPRKISWSATVVRLSKTTLEPICVICEKMVRYYSQRSQTKKAKIFTAKTEHAGMQIC